MTEYAAFDGADGVVFTTDHLNQVDTLVQHFEGLSLEMQGLFLERVNDSHANIKETRKRQLLDELAKLGVSPGAIVTATAPAVKRTRKPSSVLYRSKTDPLKSWPGRGKTPSWLVEEMDATGLPKEAFLASAV